MNTIEILRDELGDERVKRLEENALLMLVEWSMIKYHESQVKKLNIPYVMPPLACFKERRIKLGYSMQHVTTSTGVSKATISRIERGRDADYSNVKSLHDFYTANGA